MIDGHAHVFGPATQSGRGVDELAPADRQAEVSEYLDLLGTNGITGAVLVPLDGDDTDVAAALADHPGRFAGVAVATADELGTGGVDPVAALRRRRERWDFDAVRLRWLGPTDRPLAESPAMPLLRHLADTGLIVWSYLPPDQLPLLVELPAVLPGLRIVLNHLGFGPRDMRVDEHGRPRFDDPFPASLVDTLERLADHAAVHVLVSGQYALSAEPPPYPDLDPVIRRLAAAFGPERLLWGSDHPWPSQEPGYDVLTSLVDAALPHLGPAQRERVLGGTAAELFPVLRTEESIA